MLTIEEVYKRYPKILNLSNSIGLKSGLCKYAQIDLIESISEHVCENYEMCVEDALLTKTPGNLTLRKGKLVSEPIYEKCVVCEKQTGIPVDEHIDQRNCYVEGAGQLCLECWADIYKPTIK